MLKKYFGLLISFLLMLPAPIHADATAVRDEIMQVVDGKLTVDNRYDGDTVKQIQMMMLSLKDASGKPLMKLTDLTPGSYNYGMRAAVEKVQKHFFPDKAEGLGVVDAATMKAIIAYAVLEDNDFAWGLIGDGIDIKDVEKGLVVLDPAAADLYPADMVNEIQKMLLNATDRSGQPLVLKTQLEPGKYTDAMAAAVKKMQDQFLSPRKGRLAGALDTTSLSELKLIGSGAALAAKHDATPKADAPAKAQAAPIKAVALAEKPAATPAPAPIASAAPVAAAPAAADPIAARMAAMMNSGKPKAEEPKVADAPKIETLKAEAPAPVAAKPVAVAPKVEEVKPVALTPKVTELKPAAIASVPPLEKTQEVSASPPAPAGDGIAAKMAAMMAAAKPEPPKETAPKTEELKPAALAAVAKPVAPKLEELKPEAKAEVVKPAALPQLDEVKPAAVTPLAPVTSAKIAAAALPKLDEMAADSKAANKIDLSQEKEPKLALGLAAPYSDADAKKKAAANIVLGDADMKVETNAAKAMTTVVDPAKIDVMDTAPIVKPLVQKQGLLIEVPAPEKLKTVGPARQAAKNLFWLLGRTYNIVMGTVAFFFTLPGMLILLLAYLIYRLSRLPKFFAKSNVVIGQTPTPLRARQFLWGTHLPLTLKKDGLVGLGGIGKTVAYLFPGAYGDCRVKAKGDGMVMVNGFPLMPGGPIASVRLSDKDRVAVQLGSENFGPMVFQGS